MTNINNCDVYDKYRNITRRLIETGTTITTMESATSGRIASLITDTEGSSAIFKGAMITYSNETKIMAGVSPAILNKYSVYSKETAIEMAKVCREKFDCDIGIGVTGTMGNVDPANVNASVPGIVYYAIVLRSNKTLAYEDRLPVCESRAEYKLAVADKVADALLNILN